MLYTWSTEVGFFKTDEMTYIRDGIILTTKTKQEQCLETEFYPRKSTS